MNQIKIYSFKLILKIVIFLILKRSMVNFTIISYYNTTRCNKL